MSVRSLFESTINDAKQDVAGIRTSLLGLKGLAKVFPEIVSESPFYSIARHNTSMLRFPPTLQSVIYAAFHKNDDPLYYSIIADAVTDDTARLNDGKKHNDASNIAGGRNDPESGRLVPYAIDSNTSMQGDAIAEQRKSRRGGPTLAEARHYVMGVLNNPEKLKNIGKNFGVYLFDLEDHIEGSRTRKAMLEDMTNVMNDARNEYVEGLSSSKRVSADDNGLLRELRPNPDVKISDDEVYAFIACRMSEHYADDVEHEVNGLAGKKFNDWFWSNSPDITEMPDVAKGNDVTIADTVEFVHDWVEGRGATESREYQTGEGRSEYIALKIFNDSVDLTGAPVAPEYLRPMFAQDCAQFTGKRGAKNEISKPNVIGLGYELIADALGMQERLPRVTNTKGEVVRRCDGADLDAIRAQINDFIAELAMDRDRANEVRNAAIAKLKSKLGDANISKLVQNILRQVFQLMPPDFTDTQYPGVAGYGDEILLRKTSVAEGEITSRILKAVKQFPKQYVVVSDDKGSGAVTVKLGDETVTFRQGAGDGAENPDSFIKTTLFPYIDSTTSYATYTEWLGVVPYSRAVDNQLEHLNVESDELNAVRQSEGPEIAQDTLDSMVGARQSASMLTGTTDFYDNPPSKKEIASTLPAADRRLINSCTDGELQAYAIVKSITEYDSKLKLYLHTAIGYNRTSPVDDDTAIATASYRYAFYDVFGNIKNLVSDASYEDLKAQAVEKARMYAAVMYNNPDYDAHAKGPEAIHEKMNEAKDYAREMCFNFTSALKSRDIPSEIASAYNGDANESLNAFRTFLMDLALSGTNFVKGYGYQFLNDINTYTGGKYDTGNRMLVTYDSEENIPLGRLGDANLADMMQRVDSARQAEVEQIAKLASIVKTSSMGSYTKGPRERVIPGARPETNRALLNQVKQMIASIPGVDQARIEEVVDAFKGRGFEQGTLVQVYACVYAALVAIILNGDVAKTITPLLMSLVPDSYTTAVDGLIAKAEEVDSKSGTVSGILLSVENARKNLKLLTSDGKLLEPIYNAFRGNAVGDEAERKAYAKMAASALSVIKNSHDIDSLKQNVAQFFHTEPSKLSQIFDETIPLDDMPESENAVEQQEYGIGEYVAENMPQWTPNGKNYAGLTGYFGFDSVRTGETHKSSAAERPLVDGESAFVGLSQDAMIACADHIQSAREELKELESRAGSAQADALKTEHPLFWADDVIDYIGTNYMEIRLSARLLHSPNGVVLDNASGAEWLKITKNAIDGVKQMCANGKIMLPAAAAIRYEVSNFLDRKMVVGALPVKYDDVMKISTGFAHIILRLGDMTKIVKMPNPLRGLATPNSDIPGAMQDVAAERAFPKEGRDDSVEHQYLNKSDAHELLNQARDSVTDDNLAHELESLYNDFAMDATSGAHRVLNYFVRNAHDVDNKLHRMDTDINVGAAANSTAAMWLGHILRSEATGDRQYTALKKILAEQIKGNAVQFIGDVFELLGLNEPAKYGSRAGMTYAEMGFSNTNTSAKSAKTVAAKNLLTVPKYLDSVVRALRFQIADRLMDNRSFSQLAKEDPALIQKIADTFFNLAGNLDGGKTAAIFAALDPAERNAAHAAFAGKVRDEINTDETIGAAYDSDEFTKELTGAYPTHDVGSKSEIKQLIGDIIEPDGKTNEAKAKNRADAYAKLGDLAGEDAVDFVQSKLGSSAASKIMADGTSVSERDRMSELLSNKIITLFGTDPRGAYDRGTKIDTAIANTSEKLANALHGVLTAREQAAKLLGVHTAEFVAEVGKNSALLSDTGMRSWLSANHVNNLDASNVAELVKLAGLMAVRLNEIKAIEGAGYIDFVESCRITLESRGDNHYTLDGIKDLLGEIRESGAGGWYTRLMKYAANQAQTDAKPGLVGKRRKNSNMGDFERELDTVDNKLVGSVNASNTRSRAVGGNFGESYLNQSNTRTFDAIKNTVRKELMNIPLGADEEEMNQVFQKLKKGTGFEGSIRKFMQELLYGHESRHQLASRYANDPKNYSASGVRRAMNGPIGALAPEAAKTPMRGDITEADMRWIAHIGIPGISMVIDADGEETDNIIIGNNQPMNINTPVARMTMRTLINKAEQKLGKSIFDDKGDIIEEAYPVLRRLAQGNVAAYDPIVATDRAVPVFVGIIQNSMDSSTGRPWAVRDDKGNFVHKFTDENKNMFSVTFGVDKIKSIVNSLFNGKYSDASQEELKQAIGEFLSRKKSSIPSNMVVMVENRVKGDINGVAERIAKDLVAAGDIKRSDRGVRVEWLNPPEPENPPPVRARGPVRGPRANAPAPKPVAAPAPEPVPPVNAGAQAPKKARAPRKPKVTPAAPPPASEEEPV